MLLSSRFTARVEVTAEQRRRREIKGGPVDFHAPRCHAQNPDTLVTLSAQSTCSERLRRWTSPATASLFSALLCDGDGARICTLAQWTRRRGWRLVYIRRGAGWLQRPRKSSRVRTTSQYARSYSRREKGEATIRDPRPRWSDTETLRSRRHFVGLLANNLTCGSMHHSLREKEKRRGSSGPAGLASRWLGRRENCR